MTFTAKTPPSVSCHTIPSKVTDVPGSHGPKWSGSVIVPTDVPTHTSTISFGSHFNRFKGGEDVLLSSDIDDAPDDIEMEFPSPDNGSVVFAVNCALSELSFILLSLLFEELLFDWDDSDVCEKLRIE